MKCYTCDLSDFHPRPDINKKKLLLICKNCGAAMYQVEPSEESKILEFYRKEYRPAPNIQNLITSAHKQHYVRLFLRDWLKGKKGLVCGDVGSAIGYIPNMLRQMGHKATGCEYTLTYRRFCQHFYGIPLTEELDERYQYDFISLYHVFEHLVEPDVKLKKYVSMLKPDGRILISTPEWFGMLEEASGMPLISIGHLFHENHINAFSAQSLKNVFAKCGLVIEKEDHISYGQTYLLRKAISSDNNGSKGDELVIVNEDWKIVSESLNQQVKALELFTQRKYTEAIDNYQYFPEAWLKLIFEVNMKVPERQTELFKKAIDLMPDSSRLKLSYAIHLYQMEKHAEAVEVLKWLIEHRPSEDIMMYLGWCFAHLNNPPEAIKWFYSSCDLNPQKWPEAMNWICAQASQMPTWDEIAVNQIKEQLLAQANPKIVPNDPLMAGAEIKPPIKLEVAEPHVESSTPPLPN